VKGRDILSLAGRHGSHPGFPTFIAVIAFPGLPLWNDISSVEISTNIAAAQYLAWHITIIQGMPFFLVVGRALARPTTKNPPYLHQG
jgi:hypothetical protein